MTALLDARGISLARGSRQVLQPVDLVVRAGRSHALLGPNGAGKTTTLSLLTGLLPTRTGRVEVEGIDIREPAARALIGYAPDDLPLPAALTGREYLVLHDRLRRRDDSDRAEALCTLLGIRSALARQIAEYSHGMRRKLQFVAAVMHDPLVLVLDEPYRGLDPRSAALVQRYLEGIVSAGRAVLVATHDLLRAERDSDWVWLIDSGRLVAEGTASEVRSAADAPDLGAAFARLTHGALDATAEAELLRQVLPTAESADATTPTPSTAPERTTP